MDTLASREFDAAVCRCLHALGLYLAAMAVHRADRAGEDAEAEVLETAMRGARYGLRFLCGQGRSARITVRMDAPYPRQFVLGRVHRGGSSRLCRSGALLFLGYLANEGLLQDFQGDLEESLMLSLGAGPRRMPRGH